jgi:DNA excision repair protein ERCC-4
MPKHNVPIQIIADDRERNSGVVESLSDIENVTVQTQRLGIGDYQIDGRLLVERKTLQDFAVSIIDGRLFRQMTRMANSGFKGVLILEGKIQEISGLGLTREAMQGGMITVSLILGIPVLRSQNPSETAKLIVYCARQITSVSQTGIYRQGYRPKTKRKRQLYILQGFPGVGRERADRLLDKFGSIEAVVSASSQDLQAVSGIGKRVADKIRWAVSE